MQKILVGLWVKNFISFNFIFTEAKFLHNCFWQSLIISKQAIKLTHMLNVNFEWKFESVPIKSALCILKIYSKYKLPVFRTDFLKLQI